MSIRDRLSGNEAIAIAMKQINPDVVAAFPITPSTEIPQYFSTFVNNGTVDTEFVPVESEHSAMSACVGASAAGARAMTATSSNGLSLMWEILYIASSSRLPIVMSCVNRTVSGPLNIHNDHTDSMGARDSGWIQIYSENNQEAYDNMLMAHLIGENEKVMLPVMICQDGFITSHAVGPLDLQAYLFEHKRDQAEGMKNAKEVILEVSKKFEEMTGRKYGLFEEYMMEDAEIAIVVLNSTAGTAKYVVNKLREKGIKAGLIKPRVYRPFPVTEIADALKGLKAIAVMDKADSLNAAGGPLFTDVTSAMFVNNVNVPTINYIYGLGGRDVKEDDIEKVYSNLQKIAETGKVESVYNYLGVKGEE